jgi:putative FmdB family regulatory protein
MPIFEYVCKECDHRFEKLVQRSDSVSCPSCKSEQLDKLLSVFAAGTGGQAAFKNSPPVGPCGACGDPRGPGSCSMN